MAGSSGRNNRSIIPGALLCAVLVHLALAAAAAAQPRPPATYYGTASIDGAPASEGARVTAHAGDVDCTEDGSGEVLLQGETAVYVLSVVHESQRPGCAEGSTLTFAIDGEPAGQTAPWQLGPTELNLNVGEGEPAPVSPAFATAQAGGLTSGVTGEADDASDGGIPWGQVAVVALALTGLAAAAGGAVLRARRRA